MKPPICELCGKSAREEDPSSRGEWINFANYEPRAKGSPPGTPRGLGYYCDQHVEAARKLAHLDSGDALNELRQVFGEVRWVPPPQQKKWWRKFF